MALPVTSDRISRGVLIVACLAAFMAFLDTTIVNIAFPALQRAFPTTSSSSISWVLNAYNIVFAALLIPAGQLADRYGRRSAFIAGLVLFTAASVGCAAAPTLAALIACRVVQATGAAILIPTGIALLLPAFAPGEQIKAIALLAAVSAVAFAAGPSVGGVLVNSGGWQLIFLINLPIGVLTIVMALRGIGKQAVQRSTPSASSTACLPDLLGALILLLGVGLLALALVQGNSWGWSSGEVVGSIAVALILVTLAVRRARRHAAPAVELDLFRSRSFTVANISVFAFAAGLAAKLLCDVLFMTSVWRYSELRTGLAVSASPLITALVATSAARWAMRIGTRNAAVLGGALYSGGCLWYVVHMGVHPNYLGDYLPGTLVTGIGIALILPTLTSTAILAIPAERLAGGAGINAMIRQLGAVLGVSLFVAIVGTPAAYNPLPAFHQGWSVAAIASGLAALSAIAIRRPERAKASRRASPAIDMAGTE